MCSSVLAKLVHTEGSLEITPNNGFKSVGLQLSSVALINITYLTLHAQIKLVGQINAWLVLAFSLD